MKSPTLHIYHLSMTPHENHPKQTNTEKQTTMDSPANAPKSSIIQWQGTLDCSDLPRPRLTTQRKNEPETRQKNKIIRLDQTHHLRMPSSKSTNSRGVWKKNHVVYLSSVDEAKWESSTAVPFLARWWARLRNCLLLREVFEFAARFVRNFSLFAHNCASRSRTRKAERERETEESAVCDRKRRRHGFRNGNIGCRIFRNCTGDIGEDVSAGDERDGRNRYGGRGSVHTAEAVATAAWVRGHTGKVH